MDPKSRHDWFAFDKNRSFWEGKAELVCHLSFAFTNKVEGFSQKISSADVSGRMNKNQITELWDNGV